MAGDWLKYHRKAKESAVFQDPVLFRFWMWLLGEAAWKNRQLLDGTRLKPGDVLVGSEDAAAQLRCGRQVVRRCLRDLERLGNITTQPTRRGTHVSVCNWGTYQNENSEANQLANQKATRSQPEANQKPTTKEESKEVQEGEDQTRDPPHSRNGRTDGNWSAPTVDEVRAYCEESRLAVDAGAFVDHYAAVGWRAGGSPVVDWRALVRRWSREDGNGQRGGGRAFAATVERRSAAECHQAHERGVKRQLKQRAANARERAENAGGADDPDRNTNSTEAVPPK